MLLKGNPSMAKQVPTLPYTTTVNSGHYTKKKKWLSKGATSDCRERRTWRQRYCRQDNSFTQDRLRLWRLQWGVHRHDTGWYRRSYKGNKKCTPERSFRGINGTHNREPCSWYQGRHTCCTCNARRRNVLISARLIPYHVAARKLGYS